MTYVYFNQIWFQLKRFPLCTVLCILVNHLVTLSILHSRLRAVHELYLLKIGNFYPHPLVVFLSTRIASASASISPFFCASDPKPQFQYLHNQQLCQFISDWLLSLDTRILIKILEIQYENSVVNYFLNIILIKILKNFMVI